MVKAKTPKTIPASKKKDEELAIKKKLEDDVDDDVDDDDDLDEDDDEDDDEECRGGGGGGGDDDDDDDDDDEDGDDDDEEGNGNEDDDDDEDDDDEDEDDDDDGDDDDDDDDEDDDGAVPQDKSPKGKAANKKDGKTPQKVEKRKNDEDDVKAKKLKTDGKSPRMTREEIRESRLRSLVILNVPEGYTVDEIKSLSSDIKNVHIPGKREDQKNVVAYLDFETLAEAERTLKSLNGKDVDGTELSVVFRKKYDNSNPKLTTIHVKGLSEKTNQADLIRAFPLCTAGRLLPHTPVHGYVDFESHDDAVKSLEELENKLTIKGTKVDLELAYPQDHQGGRNSFGGGRGNFRGGRGGGGGGFRGGHGDRGGGRGKFGGGGGGGGRGRGHFGGRGGGFGGDRGRGGGHRGRGGFSPRGRGGGFK